MKPGAFLTSFSLTIAYQVVFGGPSEIGFVYQLYDREITTAEITLEALHVRAGH
jgi:hypothetical protein